MNWQIVRCRWCGFSFENLTDRNEHERCHTEPLPELTTAPNSHPEDGGPKEIVWEIEREP